MIGKLAKSKTILGIVVTFLVALLPQFGITFSSDDGALITQAWDSAVQAISLALAFYGRVVAKGPIE